MIRAAQAVPQNLEKLPLHRWRPGARALVVGARDGVAADGAEERGSFARELSAELIAEAARKARVDALAAAWSDSLREPALDELAQVATKLGLPLIVGTAGFGDASILEGVLAATAVWLLHVGAAPGPLAAAVLARGARVEVVLALDGSPLPPLDYARAAAVHLRGRRAAAAPEDLARWRDDVRAQLPPGLAVYDDEHPHDDCACGARLVWRAGGRSRLDALDPATGACRACGRPSAIALG